MKKLLEGKNKNLVLIVLGLIILIPLSIWLLSPSEKEIPTLTNGFEATKGSPKPTEYTPPPLENPFQNMEVKPQDSMPPQEEKIFIASQSADVLAPNNSQDSRLQSPTPPPLIDKTASQEEMIRKIARTQKPSDMVAFLNEIKPNIIVLKDSLKYDFKTYVVGDKFLDFYEIAGIEGNAVRFLDGDYAYTLRFFEE